MQTARAIATADAGSSGDSQAPQGSHAHQGQGHVGWLGQGEHYKERSLPWALPSVLELLHGAGSPSNIPEADVWECHILTYLQW